MIKTSVTQVSEGQETQKNASCPFIIIILEHVVLCKIPP